MRELREDLERLTRRVANQWDWIKYLEDQRKTQMAKIDELEQIISQTAQAAERIGTEVESLRAKAEQQGASEEQIGHAIDRVTDVYQALVGLLPQPQPAEPAPEPDPEPVDQPVADPMDRPA